MGLVVESIPAPSPSHHRHSRNQGWEEQLLWETLSPGDVDVSRASPILVHFQGGMVLPGHGEGLSLTAAGLLSLGQKWLFI